MKVWQYAEGQVIAVLREAQAEAKVADLCRIYGMSETTYYNWKAKQAGLTINDRKRMKGLEDENRHLKHIVTA